MIIIGLTGKARSGKSTAAAHLVNQWGFQEISFADPLKNGLAAMLGLSRSLFDARYGSGDKKEIALQPFGASPRRMMQTLGTDWARRMIHPDFWTMLARERIENILGTVGNILPGIVISDVRFENEAKLVREYGSILRINRSGLSNLNDHESENGIAPNSRDIIVENCDTLGALHAQLDIIARAHMGILEHCE